MTHSHSQLTAPKFASAAPDYRWLANIKHFALDMDGTIYRGGTLFTDTLPFLALLKSLGIGYSFLTNNSSKSVTDYVAHLKKMGITATPQEMFTSAQASVEYLRESLPKVKRLFVLGTESLCKELVGDGFTMAADDAKDEPDAVLVGFDTHLTFSRLCRAAYWIKQGKPFIASHPDRVCPTDEPTILVDCGSICTALTEASGRVPDAVLGKPEPRMLYGLMKREGLKAENMAMVGDRLYTDIEMAHRSGAYGILVLTGESTLEDVKKAPKPPPLVAIDLTDIMQKLKQARESASVK